MSGSRLLTRVGAILFLVIGVGCLWFPPAVQAQVYWNQPVYAPNMCYPQAVYAPGGRAVVYSPYGVPSGVSRQNIYPFAPVTYWAGYYQPQPAPAVVPTTYPAGVQGPFWQYTEYRRPRGLFRRSSWQAALIPYYVAPAMYAPAMYSPTMYAPSYPATPPSPYGYSPYGYNPYAAPNSPPIVPSAPGYPNR